MIYKIKIRLTSDFTHEIDAESEEEAKEEAFNLVNETAYSEPLEACRLELVECSEV